MAIALRLAAWAVCGAVVADCTREPPRQEKAALEDSAYNGYPITLVTGQLLNDDSSLAGASGIAIIGDVPVVLESRKSPIIVFDGTLTRATATIGTYGWDQGQFRSAWALSVVPESPSHAWVFDVDLHRFTRLPDLADGKSLRSARIVPLVSDAAILDAIPVTDSEFVALGTFNAGRIAFFDGSGRMVREAGKPPAGDDTIAMAVRQQAHQGVLRMNPAGTTLAIASRYGTEVDIYSAAGEFVTRAASPLSIAPRFVAKMRGGYPTMATTDETRVGYIDLAVTRRHIYALLSGRLEGSFGGRASFGTYVHRFDWQGRLEKVYRLLGAEVVSIAVDSGDHYLLALRAWPTPGIFRFQMDSSHQDGQSLSGGVR